MRCLATFDVTSMALLFERVCRKSELAVKVVPVPRSLSLSCGLACEYPCGDEDAIRALCAERDIHVVKWHHMEES